MLGNVPKQLRPKTCPHVTDSHTYYDPCIVSLLFIPFVLFSYLNFTPFPAHLCAQVLTIIVHKCSKCDGKRTQCMEVINQLMEASHIPFHAHTATIIIYMSFLSCVLALYHNMEIFLMFVFLISTSQVYHVWSLEGLMYAVCRQQLLGFWVLAWVYVLLWDLF